MFTRIPGTKDILPGEVYAWQRIEDLSRSIFTAYNYAEIRPPIIEDAGLFNRSLGEFAEIVQKQMFLIRHEEDVYALRPEATASIVRAYIENNLDKTSGFAKLFYIGPMFRLERPQKGRLRQFHHVGCEAIGAGAPEVDIEVISLADRLLKGFGIEGYKITLNSLGCTKDKKELTGILKSELKGKLDGLCADCRNRFDQNILRILDCKNEACRQVVQKIGLQDKNLCPECKAHFAAVKAGLDTLKIGYEVSPYLVRGLDYYTRTVFEIKHGALGAQDAIGAGGRYDNLVKELGGPDAGAIGFAFGMERLLLASGAQPEAANAKLVYFVSLGEEAKKESLKLMDELRRAGVAADTDYEGKSLKGAMRKANDLKARYVLIIGDDELKKGVIMLKDMASGEQREIKAQDLVNEVKK